MQKVLRTVGFFLYLVFLLISAAVYYFLRLPVNPVFFFFCLSLGPWWALAVFESYLSTLCFNLFSLILALFLWPQAQAYTLAGCLAFILLWFFFLIVFIAFNWLMEWVYLYAQFGECRPRS